MSILDEIVAQKRAEVTRLPKRVVSPQDLRAALKARGGCRDFEAALRNPRSGRMALIADRL